MRGKQIPDGIFIQDIKQIQPLIPLKRFKTTLGTWTDALVSGASSGETGIQLPPQTITLEAGISVSNRNQFSLIGAGRDYSRIEFAGALTLFSLTNIIQGKIGGFSMIGQATAGKGILLAGNKWLTVDDVYGFQLKYAVHATSSGDEALYIPNQLNNIQAFQCEEGIRLEGTAEYLTIQNPRIYNCFTGIHLLSGNNKVIGGTVCQNVNGIIVDGAAGAANTNTDHGGIYTTSVNHNQMVGIAVRNTSYSFSICNVQIWATIGPNGVKGDYDGYGTNFGVFLKNCKNIELTGNISHNRVNIGIDGLKTSNIDVILKSSPSETEFHIKDYGTGTNSKNTFKYKTDGALLAGETRGYVPFTDAKNQTNEIFHFSTLTPRTKVLSGSTPTTYEHTGDTANLTLKTDYTGTASLAPIWRHQVCRVSVIQVAALQTVSLTVTGASSLVSTNALAKVSGSVVTFYASGDYWFEPTGDDSFVIHSNAVRTLPVTPTFINSWAALGSTIEQPVYWLNNDGTVETHGLISGGASMSVPFVYAAGYRPLKETFRSFNASEMFGACQISANGNIQVKVISMGNWVGFNGMRFSTL